MDHQSNEETQQASNEPQQVNQPKPGPAFPPSNHPSGLHELPNSTVVLVLGIISLPLSLCYGIFGLILGIVTLVLAKEPRALYLQNPTHYFNYSNVQTGRICAIIAIVISCLWLLLLVAYFILIGSILGMAAMN